MTLDKKAFQSTSIQSDIAKQYDQVGDAYIAVRAADSQNALSHPSILFIRKHLTNTRNRSLVDIGCGGGEDLSGYAQLGFKEVRGIDSSPVMVEAAQRRLRDKAIVELGTWSRLPLPDSSEDFVVGRSSVHYEENLDSAYREASRVLKAGGQLIIVAPHPEKAKNRSIVRHGNREYVQDNLFHGKVPIKYPRHELNEYFSDVFNQLFELRERKDILKQRPYGIEPDQLAFVARKR